MRRFRFAGTLVMMSIAGLVLAPGAGAAFSGSQITSPASTTFALWNAAEASSITVAGTTSGSTPGEEVDVDCFTGGATLVLEAGVPVAGNGSFFANAVSLEHAAGRLCRLRAVPAGTVPADPSPFAGPLLAVGASAVHTFPSGPSEGRAFDFNAESVGLTAGSTALSIGRCGIGEFLENAALERTTRSFECGGRLWRFDDYQEPSSSTRSQIQVDGVDAWAPATVNEVYGGNPEHFPAVSYSASQDAATGSTTVQDGEEFVTCTPTACTPTGVRDSRTIETTEDGHVVTVTDRYASTDGEPHALDLLPESIQAFGPTGAHNGEAIAYRFPGEGAYATHPLGAEVAFGGDVPAAIWVQVEGAPDGDQLTGRGAIVLDRPASPARFNLLEPTRSGFELHQTATVPASGSTDFRTAYVQAYTQAEVEALVAKVERSFAPPSEAISAPASNPPAPAPPAPPKPSIRVKRVKLDRAAGTAVLLAQVDEAGRVVLTGKGIAATHARSKGAGVVRLLVRAKGKAAKKLRRAGRAKVRAHLQFRATEGGRARTARALVLELR